MTLRNLAADTTFHLNLAEVNWWVFTVVLGVALLILGIVKKVWIGFIVWLVELIVFTILESFMHHQKVVHGAKVSHPSNWSIHFNFSSVNWWVFQLVLFGSFVILGLTKKKWLPAGIMLVMGIAFGLWYGFK